MDNLCLTTYKVYRFSALLSEIIITDRPINDAFLWFCIPVQPQLSVQLLVSVYLSHFVPLHWKDSTEGGQLLSAKSCPLLLLFTQNTSISLLLMDWDSNQIWPLKTRASIFQKQCDEIFLSKKHLLEKN